jgi:hypothetical protein
LKVKIALNQLSVQPSRLGTLMESGMKRIYSGLAAAGVLGTALVAGGPASAATSSIDCAASGPWDQVHELYVPTNVERYGVNNAAWNANGPEKTTYEVCLDIPDGETFTIRVKDLTDDEKVVFEDDRPGDKAFSYTMPPNSWWRIDGTMTGPDSTFLYYTWHQRTVRD